MDNPFDKKIKSSLEGFEMPYDEGAWSELEKQLPHTKAGTGHNSGWRPLLYVAAIILVGALAYLTWHKGTVTEEHAKSAQIEPLAAPQTATDAVMDEQPAASTTPEVAVQEPAPASTSDSETDTENESGSKSELPSVKETSTAPRSQTDLPTDLNASDNLKDPEMNVRKNAESVQQYRVMFVANSLTACTGEEVSFTNRSSENIGLLLWDFGDGTTEQSSGPNHSYVLPGDYTVTLSAESGDSRSEYALTVHVNPSPMPMFSASPKLENSDAIPLYRFATALQPNEKAVWEFSDGGTLEGNVADHLFCKEGNSVAKLTVSNSEGCTTAIDREYATHDFNLLAPNTFTPNGDGMNETFIPEALTVMGIEFEMSITDPRTGAAVYQTTSPEGAWNGSLNNIGPVLEPGVYVWTVVLKEPVTEHHLFKGTISLHKNY